MRKLVVLFVMLLWIIPTTTLASPIFNDGSCVTIQLNGSNTSYGKYVNSGDLVTIRSDNNEGNNFNLFNTYMEDNHGVTLTSVFNIDYNDSGGTTGIWGTPNAPDAIDFYVVKASNNFAVYSVNPGDNYGSWSTYDLWLNMDGSGNSLEISHLTGYQASPVPIPTTLLLFGSGLLGLVGIKRKRLL